MKTESAQPPLPPERLAKMQRLKRHVFLSLGAVILLLLFLLARGCNTSLSPAAELEPHPAYSELNR